MNDALTLAVRRRRQQIADAEGMTDREVRTDRGRRGAQTAACSLTLFALVVGGLEMTGAHGQERANCGYGGVEVRYEHPGDLDMACQALADTVAYFRRIGFQVEPKFSLTFSRDEGRSSGRLLHGQFEPRGSRIVVNLSSSIRPWGLDWSKQLAASFLRHELVHMAVWQIIRGDRKRLPHEWHEFIAYAVQLDLMDRELLDEVLAKAASVQAFATLSEVNEFTYSMNPEVFAVAAYRTYREKGAQRFVGQLLRGEVVPPPFSYPFPVLPEPSPTH